MKMAGAELRLSTEETEGSQSLTPFVYASTRGPRTAPICRRSGYFAGNVSVTRLVSYLQLQAYPTLCQMWPVCCRKVLKNGEEVFANTDFMVRSEIMPRGELKEAPTGKGT